MNFSIVGFDLDNGFVEISQSFNLLVDTSNRFILNTSSADPLYFPYWTPVGTKAGDETFMGHQRLENVWLNGKFYLYGGEDIDTAWKTFHMDDILFCSVENMSGLTPLNPLIFLPPVFDAFYDKGTGFLIKIYGTEPLLLKFLNIYTDIPPGFVTSDGKREHGMVLDSVGVEPVDNAVAHDHGSSTTPNSSSAKPSILVSSIVTSPPQIEIGKEFELSLTVLNNGTIDAGNLKALLSPLNESVRILSAKEVLVGDMRSGESKEVEWRLILQSEGECSLRCSILEDNVTLLQRDLVVKGESPPLQGVELFIIILFILVLISASIALLRSRNKRKYAHLEYREV